MEQKQSEIITKEPPILQPITADNHPKYIRKKKEYRAFLKLIKEGRFTTALLTAKALHVHDDTIKEWLNTPKVQAALEEDIDLLVSRIRVSKKWQASAYLLDKILPPQKEETKPPQQVVIINNAKQFSIKEA